MSEILSHSFRVPRVVSLSLCAVAFALASGCISVKSYVDPALPNVEYTNLKAPAEKHPVQLLFEFKNAKGTSPAVTDKMRPKAVAILEQSKMFSQVVTAPKTADQKLFITIENFPVTKDAASKGVGVGLTFGLAGTMVTDGYSMEAVYQVPSKPEIKKSYKHAIHSTIGNASGPPGLVGMPPQDAFDKVMEGLLLNLMSDLSKERVL